MSEKKVMIIGFNPALQKVLTFSSFHQGEVNRAESITYIHGGKGANYAKALALFGFDSMLFQFIGGGNGERYCKILNDECIDYKNCITEAETRVCCTCIFETAQSVTEIIEPSGVISHDEVIIMRQMILTSMKNYDAVCICGTFPPGIDSSLYALIVKEAVKLRIPVLIDSYIGIDSVLKEGPDFLKINLKEFRDIVSESDLQSGVDKFFRDYKKVKVLALTDGPNNSYLFTNSKFGKKDLGSKKLAYKLPYLDKVINPIGAGDTVGAGFISSVLNGETYNCAFKKGLAAASASCLEKNNASFNTENLEILLKKITEKSF
jgi:fructose-1-phosphate kinase PfkB-like protein